MNRELTIVEGPASRKIRLVDEIARGGEGTTYRTSENDLAAKIWFHADPGLVRKVRHMVERGAPTVPARSRIAWPTGLLLDGGAFVGFAMPRVRDPRSLYEISYAGSRLSRAKYVTWRFQHDVASRLSAAVDAVHRTGAVIGDLNPKNVLIESTGDVWLIDVDSWQIPDVRERGGHFFCEVIFGEFAAPETIGSGIKHAVRSPESDRFVLAILIYYALFSQHPFRGKWLPPGEMPSIEDLIRNGHSVFDPSGRMTFAPEEMHPDRLWPPMAAMFRRAFAPGQNAVSRRPTAAEWHDALTGATEVLSTCSRNHKHFRFDHWHDCYWCNFANRESVDLFPADGLTHPYVEPFEQRIAIALRTGDDQTVADACRRSTILAAQMKARPDAAAIGRALARVDLLDKWCREIGAPDAGFWTPLDRWPRELDGSPLARTHKVQGKTIESFLADLRDRRKLVAKGIRAAEEWSRTGDLTNRECIASSVVAALTQAATDLPDAAPEARRLRKALSETTGWLDRYATMRNDIGRARRCLEEGDYEEATRYAENQSGEWDDYAPLSELRSNIAAFRSPWDTPEFRRKIRIAVETGDFVRAKSRLKLLPTIAMSDVRRRVDEELRSFDGDSIRCRDLLDRPRRSGKEEAELNALVVKWPDRPRFVIYKAELKLARRVSPPTKGFLDEVRVYFRPRAMQVPEFAAVGFGTRSDAHRASAEAHEALPATGANPARGKQAPSLRVLSLFAISAVATIAVTIIALIAAAAVAAMGAF